MVYKIPICIMVIMKSLTLKITFVSAVITFYFGDLLTTYIALSQGLRESNPLFNYIGFTGVIIVKTLFLIWTYWMLGKLEEKGYSEAGNFVTGAVFMLGLMTIMINLGLYYKY